MGVFCLLDPIQHGEAGSLEAGAKIACVEDSFGSVLDDAVRACGTREFRGGCSCSGLVGMCLHACDDRPCRWVMACRNHQIRDVGALVLMLWLVWCSGALVGLSMR